MARVAYGDENSSPAVRALADQIRRERDGRMLNLYSMLLNAPPVAEGWLALFTAIRQQCTLRGDYRELVILRVALLNGASYEYQVHVPFALREGVTQAQIDALDDWENASALTAAQRAVLAVQRSALHHVRSAHRAAGGQAEQPHQRRDHAERDAEGERQAEARHARVPRGHQRAEPEDRRQRRDQHAAAQHGIPQRMPHARICQ